MELKDCKVGLRVVFGRNAGELTLGEIVKVNAVKCKVKQLEARGTNRAYPVGTVWGVPPSLLKPADGSFAACATPAPIVAAPPKAKRPDAEIMRDIQGCYNQLSPENLYCDGEISRSAGARRAVAINARLKVLFAEIGRKVSEDEAFGLPPTAARVPLFAKATGFKAGDKVTFTASKTGEVVVGYVRTLNTKSVTVDPIGAQAGRYWRVPPTMLKLAA